MRGPGHGKPLIDGIAIRPCSGAILLLLLTWRMSIFPDGGHCDIRHGTAAVTLVVAGLARRGSFLLVPAERMSGPASLLRPGLLQAGFGVIILTMSALLPS